MGAADFLTKPLDTTTFIEKIETLVVQSRALSTNDAENSSERRHNERRREKNERRQTEPDRRKNERRLNEDRRLQSNDPVIAYIQQHAAQISKRQDVANILDMTLEQVSARVQSRRRGNPSVSGSTPADCAGRHKCSKTPNWKSPVLLGIPASPPCSTSAASSASSLASRHKSTASNIAKPTSTTNDARHFTTYLNC